MDLGFNAGQEAIRAKGHAWLDQNMPADSPPWMDAAGGFEVHRQSKRTSLGGGVGKRIVAGGVRRPGVRSDAVARRSVAAVGAPWPGGGGRHAHPEALRAVNVPTGLLTRLHPGWRSSGCRVPLPVMPSSSWPPGRPFVEDAHIPNLILWAADDPLHLATAVEHVEEPSFARSHARFTRPGAHDLHRWLRHALDLSAGLP